MAQEINEGTAYLMALSRSVQQTSAAGAAPASEAASTAQAEIVPGAPTDGDTFKEAEKRRSPRYNAKAARRCERTVATYTPGRRSPTSACMDVPSKRRLRIPQELSCT